MDEQAKNGFDPDKAVNDACLELYKNGFSTMVVAVDMDGRRMAVGAVGDPSEIGFGLYNILTKNSDGGEAEEELSDALTKAFMAAEGHRALEVEGEVNKMLGDLGLN